jgi:threonine/homoserine/homoserine lactone efflux protein
MPTCVHLVKDNQACMNESLVNGGLFSLSATALLGSPGPGIAALIAVGRRVGFWRGLRFFAGLQAGLALAAALTAWGVLSLHQAASFIVSLMTWVATLYLIWLAYRIATAPVSAPPPGSSSDAGVPSVGAGLLLALVNPKSYLAFATLMAAYVIVPADPVADLAAKWTLCVAVMIAVDLAWLYVGIVAGRARLSPTAERSLNVALGATILVTAVIGVF